MKVFSWNDVVTKAENANLSAFFETGSALTIGSFDGPHKGHLELFKSVLNYSKANNVLSGIVTFQKPLPAYKHTSSYMGDISTLQERLKVFEQLGFDFCILIEFNESFSNIDGEAFFYILKKELNLVFIAEGEDFKCGHNGLFNIERIKDFCLKNEIQFDFLPLVKINGERISSSKIRELIYEARTDEADKLLINAEG